MKPKLKVGDVLIAHEFFRHPSRYEAYEVTVSKVGHKYFEITRPTSVGRKPFLVGKFLVDTWLWADSNSNVNRPIHLFQTQEEMHQWIEHRQKKFDLHQWWTASYSALDKLTHQQVAQIHDIVFLK